MNEPLFSELLLVLADGDSQGHVLVDLERYQQFDEWVDQQLSQLRGRWASHAAPVAARACYFRGQGIVPAE